VRPIITWFVDNAVAANLLMFLFIAGGLGAMAFAITLEEFPNIDPDVVQIRVPYLGAAPEEVERPSAGASRRPSRRAGHRQDALHLRTEGMCTVTIELDTDFDTTVTANNIKARVDGINTFPVETEKPVVSKFVVRGRVMQIAVHGSVGEAALKELGQELRNEIVACPASPRWIWATCVPTRSPSRSRNTSCGATA
jgi:multidrug efflux pump subunit AcrB